MKEFNYLKYVALIIIFATIEYFDVTISFQPIGTFLALMLILIVAFYKKIINEYLSPIHIGQNFIVVCLVLVCINVFVGIILNKVVDESAEEVISSIYLFQKENGKFPRHLLEISPGINKNELKTNKLKFGAKYFYYPSPKGEVFDFKYKNFPFGSKSWDQKKQKFVDDFD